MTVYPFQRRAVPKPPCSVEGCGGRVIARGWCSMHYARWRNTGSTDPYRTPLEFCAVESCERAPRSTYAEYCEMHYYRLRRTGTVADPIRPPETCIIDGCDKATGHYASGICRMHHLRMKIRGSYDFEYVGPNNQQWTGDEASYNAIHLRLRMTYGRAGRHACVDCGKRARHWSYNHSGIKHRVSSDGLHYSTDISQYEPRCASCHTRFDRARAAERRGA